jgi:hypothetical protein
MIYNNNENDLKYKTGKWAYLFLSVVTTELDIAMLHTVV